MSAIAPDTQTTKQYFFHVFQYLEKPAYDEIPIESAQRYRNAAVCRLLRYRWFVHEDDLLQYWEIIDEILDLTLPSAIKMLQNLYECRVRKLPLTESQYEYPEITNSLYRLEYDDQQGGSRDVCVSTLFKEAIDLLQEEADRLISIEC